MSARLCDRRDGVSNQMVVAFSVAISVIWARLADVVDARNPANMNWSVGSPETASAARTALGPGTESTGISRSRQAATSL